MARRTRHSQQGSVYHVIMRGNNRQTIFSSDEERSHFCLLLQEGVERFGYRVLAFCLMTNHVHLAVQVGDVSLSKIYQNLAFRYTSFFNRRHQTIGHLFQGRFKSILVEGKDYLRRLIRYIHLNPVRANMTRDPLHYPWSSHLVYLKKKEFTWLASDCGLQLFGDSPQEALDTFQHFVLSGIDQEEEVDFKKGIKGGIIGTEAFIEKTQSEIDSKIGKELTTIDFETLLSVAADLYTISQEELKSQSHKASHFRAVVALLARKTNGVTLKELAIHFDRADNSMSQIATRLETQMQKNDQLEREFSKLKEKLIQTSKDLKNRKCEA